MAKPSLIEHAHGTSQDKRETIKETVSGMTAMASLHAFFAGTSLATKNLEKRRAYLSAFSSKFDFLESFVVFLL